MNDGGPAFPFSGEAVDADTYKFITQGGMSLRDYFSAHAPISFNDAKHVCGFAHDSDINNDTNRGTIMAVLALMRVEYADAILKERAK